MRLSFLFVVVLLFSGCASTQKINLEGEGIKSSGLTRVTDTRPKKDSQSEYLGTWLGLKISNSKSIGDEHFNTPPLVVLNSHLESLSIEQVPNQSVIVNRFLIANIFPESGTRGSLYHNSGAIDRIECLVEGEFLGKSFTLNHMEPYHLGIVMWSVFESDDFVGVVNSATNACIQKAYQMIKDMDTLK